MHTFSSIYILQAAYGRAIREVRHSVYACVDYTKLPFMASKMPIPMIHAVHLTQGYLHSLFLIKSLGTRMK